MCNERPIKKRKVRGPNKPRLSEYDRMMNRRMLQYHFALKDRPPGCMCVHKGDTCKVCRPEKYSTPNP